MKFLSRVAPAALSLALILLPGPRAGAQAVGGTLPAVQARPPARRPAARPAAQRPAAPVRVVAARVPVKPAVDPGPLPAAGGRLPDNGERWTGITPDAANQRPASLPIGRGHEGAAVLHVQILLERAHFSPGMLDGRWGRNTEVAVFWLQAREGLPATGVVDSATLARLRTLAGTPEEVVRKQVLTAEDVRGPFTRIPTNIYEQARLSCSCYETLTEKLTELFHVRVELLRRLNPGVDLDKVAAGATLHVPAGRPADAPSVGQIAELWVSGEQNFLQAVDAQGRILYHFPTTLGSSYDPSPQGNFAVRSVHPDPWWHYQPKILAHVPDDRPDARIPPGPNNSVGRVWMALTAPHYGIHGTKSPETIGYATSAGCVRLTNWDVLFLSRQVAAGTAVRFRDTRVERPQPAAPATAPASPPLLGVRVDSVQPDSTAARPAAAPADSAARPAAPAPARPDSAGRGTG